jgi:hypothetical protein
VSDPIAGLLGTMETVLQLMDTFPGGSPEALAALALTINAVNSGAPVDAPLAQKTQAAMMILRQEAEAGDAGSIAALQLVEARMREGLSAS